MNRAFYKFTDLEEYEWGMWAIARGELRKANMERAAALMCDPCRFTRAMMAAINGWPKSCAHNLTVDAANRIAWLGHAGCCIAAMSPEENTRCAWHTLTKRQQDVANACALLVLNRWERRHRPPALPLFAWSAKHA
jgi:hypothetical protein